MSFDCVLLSPPHKSTISSAPAPHVYTRYPGAMIDPQFALRRQRRWRARDTPSLVGKAESVSRGELGARLGGRIFFWGRGGGGRGGRAEYLRELGWVDTGGMARAPSDTRAGLPDARRR